MRIAAFALFRRALCLFLPVWILALASCPAYAGDAYFIVMLSYQRTLNLPRYTHSFASYIHACWPEPGSPGGKVNLDIQTISWLPCTTVLRPTALFPETGHNFRLDETLDIAQRNDARVSLWGPYQIEPELFERARDRVAELESGQVRYKMNDTGRRSARVCNCIHAISAIDSGGRLRVLSPDWGEEASFTILQRQRRWIIDTQTTHDWLIYPLGLQNYPIIYRDWSFPVSGTFLGTLYRLLGGERNLEATYGPPQCRKHLGILHH